MVTIAIAGSSGEVAREVVDALVARQRHQILLLTRKDASSLPTVEGTEWIQTDYTNLNSLIKTFRGVHVVLSFITSQTDPGNQAQKNLIDAAIQAGVKRFAPSEWATSSFEHMDWYAGKAEIREYLQEINRSSKVLEYTLFQPGLFLNYFTHPYKSAKHVNAFELQFDFQNRRAIVPDGCNDVKITLTAAKDLANVVARAVEYEGEWPVVGGIKGCELSIGQLISLGEEVRGGPFAVEKLKIDDLKAGKVESSWLPKLTHQAIPVEQREALAQTFLAGVALGIAAGAFNVFDEWNRLLPDYEFVQPRPFLSKAWKNKP